MTTRSYYIYEYLLRRDGARWTVAARREVFSMYS